MASKTYKSTTGIRYSFSVVVSEVTYSIDLNPTYTTTIAGVQSAIEAKAYFTSGRVVEIGNYTDQVKAIVTTDVVSGKILTSEIATAGTDYVADDIIELSSATGKKAIIRILTVVEGTGAVATYELTDQGTIYAADDVLTVATTTSTAGADFTLKVLTTTAATEFPEEGPFKAATFADVINMNQAKDILRAEPYNVHHMKLRTPDAIMAQAIEHSVRFPNWII